MNINATVIKKSLILLYIIYTRLYKVSSFRILSQSYNFGRHKFHQPALCITKPPKVIARYFIYCSEKVRLRILE